MSQLSDLCLIPVAATDGVPLGIPGYPNFRFVVQLAVVSPPNILPFILGTSQLGGPRWRDITHDIQGLHWERGGAPAERPIAGELTFRLNNPHGQWSPWKSSFYAPGTMCRIAVGDGTTTHPQFCGQVVSWGEGSVGLNAYEWIDVVVWENMFLLNEVNDHALDGVVGGGDTLTQRVDRLLDQADWQFDRDIEDTTGATFQSSDFPQDVATEMYLTVDSVDATVWPGKDGMLMIRDRATGSGVSWTLPHGDQNPDTLVTANDDTRLLSSVDLSRVGGTSQTFTNSGIAGRYHRRSTQRNDLITVAEAADADLQRVADGILGRSKNTVMYRPTQFEVQSGHGANAAQLIIEHDLTDRVTLTHGPIIFHDYAICGAVHDVTVAAGGVYWTTTFSLDIETDSVWELVPVVYARWGESHWGDGSHWRAA